MSEERVEVSTSVYLYLKTAPGNKWAKSKPLKWQMTKIRTKFKIHTFDVLKEKFYYVLIRKRNCGKVPKS